MVILIHRVISAHMPDPRPRGDETRYLSQKEVLETIATSLREPSSPDRDQSVRRLLKRWHERSDNPATKVQWPQTDYREMNRLYKESEPVWELLSSFSGSFQFFRNENWHLSDRLPASFWADANKIYPVFEKEILDRNAEARRDGKTPDLEDIRERIKGILAAFHEQYDAYAVAEDELAVRHLDLFQTALRLDYIHEDGTPTTSEEHAFTRTKGLLAEMFPEEYQALLAESLAKHKQRMDDDGRKKLGDATMAVFKEYKST